MSGRSAVAAGLALGAAGCFAVSNVLQTVSVRRQPRREHIEATLVARLATQPLWLAGLAASIVGFALEAVALDLAPVLLVQPLVVSEMLFALPLAALAGGRRLGRREWTGAVLVAAGLATFSLLVKPTDPNFAAGPAKWAVLFAAVAAAVIATASIASRTSGLARTSAMAVASAVALGLLAVLTKACAHDFATRHLGALGTWEPWAVAATGMIALTLAQNTFAVGPLAVSLPLIDIGEPVVASIISATVFGEQLTGLTAGGLSGLVVAAVVATGGVVILDSSPLVQAAQRDLAKSSPEGQQSGPM